MGRSSHLTGPQHFPKLTFFTDMFCVSVFHSFQALVMCKMDFYAGSQDKDLKLLEKSEYHLLTWQRGWPLPWMRFLTCFFFAICHVCNASMYSSLIWSHGPWPWEASALRLKRKEKKEKGEYKTAFKDYCLSSIIPIKLSWYFQIWLIFVALVGKNTNIIWNS